jgi:hypothetical protein
MVGNVLRSAHLTRDLSLSEFGQAHPDAVEPGVRACSPVILVPDAPKIAVECLDGRRLRLGDLVDVVLKRESGPDELASASKIVPLKDLLRIFESTR